MRTILFDLGSVYAAAYFSTSDDASAAQNRTLRTVRDALHEYDCVAVCIDSKTSWRKDKYPAYKAQREPKPAGYGALLEDTIDKLRNECHVLGADGFEADDCIATAARWLAERNRHPVIVSEDKDLLQCLDDAAKRLRLNGTAQTAEWLDEELDLAPAQVPLWLALMGDDSDNIPGVPSVGDKRARALIADYADLDGIIGASRDGLIKGKVGEALSKALFDSPPEESVEAMLVLTTLRRDAPIDCSVLESATTPKDEPMSDTPEPEDTQPSSGEQPTQIIDAVPVESQRGETSASAPTRALVPIAVSYERALEPMTPETAWNIAQKLHRSGMFKTKNPEATFAIVAMGRQYGLSAVQSLQDTHIIEGKMSMSAGLMRGLCQGHPACEYFMPIEVSPTSATVEAKRRGYPKPFAYTFTIEMAKNAGLLGKANWKNHPDLMCLARATAVVARTLFGDVVHGCYVADELGSEQVEEAA